MTQMHRNNNGREVREIFNVFRFSVSLGRIPNQSDFFFFFFLQSSEALFSIRLFFKVNSQRDGIARFLVPKGK